MEERQKFRPVVELWGNRRAVVEGCDGIVDYTQEEILLRAGRLLVRLSGRGLGLKRLTASSAIVEGFIAQVAYSFGE